MVNSEVFAPKCGRPCKRNRLTCITRRKEWEKGKQKSVSIITVQALRSLWGYERDSVSALLEIFMACSNSVTRRDGMRDDTWRRGKWCCPDMSIMSWMYKRDGLWATSFLECGREGLFTAAHELHCTEWNWTPVPKHESTEHQPSQFRCGPIQSWRWRERPMNASCNWVDLLQVSWGQFVCCKQALWLTEECRLYNKTQQIGSL